MIEAVSGRS